MGRPEFTTERDWPDWLKEIMEEEPKHVPFRDPSGMWRDLLTKEPLYPTMETSPLPPWVREIKKLSDRGELSPPTPSAPPTGRRPASRPQ